MSENRISDEWLEHYRAFTAKVDETRDEKGVICDARQICAMATELQQRRQQDAAREKRDAAAKALANRVHQMLDNLDDRLQLSPLECSYLQAALKAWEEANDGD